MDSNKSSFINELLGELVEQTIRLNPSATLPWHIPKFFYEASYAQQQLRDPASVVDRRKSFYPGPFPRPDGQPQPEQPAPEQPLRDTLLNTATALAGMLGVEWILIASRNGGTVKRLRQLTAHFRLLVALEIPAEEHRLRQLDNVELLKADGESGSDADDSPDAGDDDGGTALERIAQEGLRWLRRQLGASTWSGAPVLFCYRSFPGANCVNAFQILHL